MFVSFPKRGNFMFKQIFANVRCKSPLIHNITNYVTINDCANILLACGSSPIMADDPSDAVEITKICAGLNINMGGLSTVQAMLDAGKQAYELKHPIILDPVGAGASKMRTDTAFQLMKHIKFTVIRGNISEMKALISGNGTTKGVDADAADTITKENMDNVVELAKEFAQRTGAVIAITSAIDIVSDGQRTFCIHNGHPMMCSVTGTGCQLSALLTAFVAANPEAPLEATAAAVCAMGLCGEIAYKRLSNLDGNATYRNYIIDAMYRLTPAELEKGARYEMR